MSEEYYLAIDKKSFLIEKLVITETVGREVELRTKGQRLNPFWHMAHKLRLTASTFGDTLSACKRNKFPPSLFKKLTGILINW